VSWTLLPGGWSDGRNILREDWKPVLNLSSVMVGLQYLFLEP
jgi:ubiquitin-protein ligase